MKDDALLDKPMTCNSSFMEEHEGRSLIEIGNYVLLQTIGNGGFSKVKLAEDKITKQRYAIKIIKKSKLEDKPELKTKIQREIALMKLFDHPHLIKLIEICESSRHIFIVLEYAENGELFDYLIARRSLPLEEGMRLFRQIIYGVDFLHNNSICHRDLKPENILLDQNNNVKIADFGFARWLKNSTTATACGSPHYAAPEVVKGIPYNGKKADIWSCGVILYALLAGRLPFNEPCFRDLITKIKNGIYRMPDFPADVKDLVARMLTVDPEKRITIEQIKHHKAFRIGLPRYYTVPLPFPLPGVNNMVSKDDAPQEVLDTLKKIGFSDDEIRKELSCMEPTPAKSFWAILTQKVSIEKLPWCEPFNNITQIQHNDSLVHPPFNETISLKDPFYRSHRFSGSLCSLSSPDLSLVDTASWAPDSIPSLRNTDDVFLTARATADQCIADLQKEFSSKSIDWLFPDDEIIFCRFKDTYAYTYVTSSTEETANIAIGFAGGSNEYFSPFIDMVCSTLGIPRPLV